MLLQSIVVTINIVTIVLLLLCLIPLTAVHGDCPSKGTSIGVERVPDILSLVKGQSGFAARVEIITPEEESILISDYFNGAKQLGTIEVDKLSQGQLINNIYYYYHATNEMYAIESETGICHSSTLELLDKVNLLQNWVSPDNVLYEANLFGDMVYLGPTGLMVWAASVTSMAQFIGLESIDGIQVKHWFHCLNDDIEIDFWFDANNNLPFRFSLQHSTSSSNSNTTYVTPHVYNYLIYNPLITSMNDLVSYPMGYGCTRMSTLNQPRFPTFIKGKDEAWSLDMEALIMYSNPDHGMLSTLRLMVYQNTYSFEITESNNVTRIIQNPDHRGRYIVSPETGTCTLDDVDYQEVGQDDLAVSWPYHYKTSFNLLQTISQTSGTNSYYMGQVDTDQGLMDLWEDKIDSFFTSGYNVDAVVTYYFPVIDRTSVVSQAPTKIVIRAQNAYQLTSIQGLLPHSIEIVTINYESDSSDLTLFDRFDISGCYDGPGQFTWFQLVISDPLTGSDLSAQIKTYAEQILYTFVPVIRLPEIIVSHFEYSFYVSVKLLERPPFQFNYEQDAHYTIKNPTAILIRDALEDCGQICTDDIACREFAYCSDATCRLFSSVQTISEIGIDYNCTWYRRRDLQIEDSLIERNILSSTRYILSQIKDKVISGQFVLPRIQLAAEDVLIVSGPDQIGGLEDEFDESQVSLKGDEYAVVASTRRLTVGQSISGLISYSDCLQLCQNDDDCYTLSYCSNSLSECVISSETKANLTQYLSEKTSHSDNCNVFKKSFIAFYDKFPGQSLVRDSETTLFDIDSSECAKLCYQSTDITCKSFDFCQKSIQGEQSQRACFLHQFHAIEDTDHEIRANMWDFSTSECDHYSVQLSRDYTHYFGRKYKPDAVEIIDTISDVSLERCASDCNLSDGNCISFEYCESVESTYNYNGNNNVKATCRLSSSQTTDQIDDESLLLSTATATCSVYLNKLRASKLNEGQLRGQQGAFGLAIGLGSVCFIVAAGAGLLASIHFQRRFA